MCHANCHHILINAYIYWKLSNLSDCSYRMFQFSDCHWTVSYFLSFTTALHMSYQYRIKGPWANILVNSSLKIYVVLAGIELIFFIVASMGLCFGFVQRTVLITQGCFRYCWAVLTQSQGLFCSSPTPSAGGLGVHKKLGGDAAGTADPNRPKGYSRPYDMLSTWSWGNEEEGRDIWSDGVCLPK